MTDINPEGMCCMARHANAVPPWTCDCPCHDVEVLDVAEYLEREYPIDNPTFPLTPDEAKLLYDELRTYTFSQHHPMYLYAHPLLSRIKSFVEANVEHLRICKP